LRNDLKIEQFDKINLGVKLLKPFVGDDIPEENLHEIVAHTVNFPFPLVQITPDIFTIELFHGPTLAFKDVGARFMSGCLSFFNSIKDKLKNTILVATSGDTGGAVAHGFYDKPGIKVVILYPKGKVSDLQERQLTTLGKNIEAIEIDGTFDDCQAMVKRAFLDEDLKSLGLTSANSINVARWLPQMLYYFFAYQELKSKNWDLKQCVILAIRESGLGMFYTSIILFCGFSVFTFSQFGGTQALGLLISLTLLIAMITNLVILPSLLLSLERKLTTKSFEEPYFDAYSEESEIDWSGLQLSTDEDVDVSEIEKER
jgi:hypothetical protein